VCAPAFTQSPACVSLTRLCASRSSAWEAYPSSTGCDEPVGRC